MQPKNPNYDDKAIAPHLGFNASLHHMYFLSAIRSAVIQSQLALSEMRDPGGLLITIRRNRFPLADLPIGAINSQQHRQLTEWLKTTLEQIGAAGSLIHIPAIALDGAFDDRRVTLHSHACAVFENTDAETAANKLHDRLKEHFPNATIGLAHGRCRGQAAKAGTQFDILIQTIDPANDGLMRSIKYCSYGYLQSQTGRFAHYANSRRASREHAHLYKRAYRYFETAGDVLFAKIGPEPQAQRAARLARLRERLRAKLAKRQKAPENTLTTPPTLEIDTVTGKITEKAPGTTLKPEIIRNLLFEWAALIFNTQIPPNSPVILPLTAYSGPDP